MKNVIIVGAGDLGKQIQHMIENYSEDSVIGWIDDTKGFGERIAGVKVIGKIGILKTISTPTSIMIAIGYNHLKFKLELINILKSNSFVELYSFIHPTAFVDKSAIIEPGSVIYPNVTIDMRVLIKSGVIVNNAVTVSHDSIIAEGTFLAPQTIISGNVKIGQGCFIGAGSVIKDGISINDFNVIGSGTNLFTSISEKYGTYISKSTLIKIR